jgi:adenylate kinase
MNVVGIFGVSGVGKTTMINAVLAAEPHWLRISGGTLIQQISGTRDRDALRALPGEVILENQIAIVRGVERVRESASAQLILFDGHLVVDNILDLVQVPFETVRALGLAGIVFVKEIPNVIRARRLADSSRQRFARTIAQISREQTLALGLAKRYSSQLNLRLKVFSPQDRDQLQAYLRPFSSPERRFQVKLDP